MNKEKTEPHFNECGRPTLLEFLAGYHVEASKIFETEPWPTYSVRAHPISNWGKNILIRFKKTTMRAILKLRPNGEVHLQQYGKIVGILNRQITFLKTDVWEIIEKEGWDKISEEKWEKIQPRAQLRAQLVKMLNRDVRDDETIEELAGEAIDKKIEQLEQMRNNALRLVSNRSAKEQKLFYRGMAQGYELFLDEMGNLTGDRGRTEIYLELLASQYEIEKMRRMLPPRNDEDLYDHLQPWYRFPNGREAGIAWLRDVCDDISLYMTGKRGRPSGPRRTPVF